MFDRLKIKVHALLSKKSSAGKEDKDSKRFEAKPPLIEMTIILRDGSGKEREIRGTVPRETRKTDAIKAVIEQNEGFCIIRKETRDFSDLRWIKSVTLNDGFTAEVQQSTIKGLGMREIFDGR